MKLQKFLLWLVASIFVLCETEVALPQANFWEPTNGPGGGEVNTLTINSEGDIFAGTDVSGVFRSKDNGQSWTPVNNGLTNPFVPSLAINSKGHIFAGTSGSGVFRSMDNGDSWTQVGLSDLDVLSIAIDVNDTVFVGTTSGVYRSGDNGENWTRVDLSDRNVVSLAINSLGHIFAGTLRIYRSIDSGQNWKEVHKRCVTFTFPFPSTTCGFIVYALAISPNGNVFAGIEGGDIFRSRDNGATWVEVAPFLFSEIFSFAINSSGQIFAGTSGDGVLRSTNNGERWAKVNSGLQDKVVASLVINSSGQIFAGTSGGEVYRSVESTTTSVTEIAGEIPMSFSLEQNYPNPFNPSTTIRYALAKPGHVILKVFNLLGKEITTLVSETMPADEYEIQWTPTDVPSGVYIYRLQVGRFFETKKLILLK